MNKYPELPSLKKKRKVINSKKVMELAEKVRKILLEEEKARKEANEDISSSRIIFGC